MNNEKENNRPQEEFTLITEEDFQTNEPETVMELPGQEETFLILSDVEEETVSEEESAAETEGEEGDVPARYGRRAMKKMGERFRDLFPRKGDGFGETLRKCVFLIAFMALLGAGGYLVYDMVYLPIMNEQTYEQVGELYNPDDPVELPEEYEDMVFPQGMTNVLKAMYAQNNDLRGYLTFTSDGDDFLDIQYPVMYSGDNEYYLNRDFYKKKNTNGALFFDELNWDGTFRNALQTTIIYGHNNLNGQMFSDIIQLTTSLDKARKAPTIALETLYGNEVYRVFAICMFDEDAKKEHFFDYRQTLFKDDETYLKHIAEIRARSYWDYNNVDVRLEDKLLVLSTCTTEYTSKLENGRIAVFARKLRSHESYENEPELITKNKDVVMPYNWYIQHDKKVSKYYTQDAAVSGTVTTTTTTTLTTTVGDDKTTTDQEGTTTTDKDDKTTTAKKKTTTKKGATTTKKGTTTKKRTTTTTKKGATTTTKKGATTTTTQKNGTTTQQGGTTTVTTTKPTTTTTASTTTTMTEAVTTTTTTVAAEE